MPETRNWAAMLEEQAANRGDHPFLYLIDQDQYISYNEMDKNANRIGNYLLANGGGPGKGIATLMENSSQFLDIFFGIQKNWHVHQSGQHRTPGRGAHLHY